MNFQNILDEIDSVDEEIYQRLDGRRSTIKNVLRKGSKLTLAGVPIALGSLFNKAYGRVPQKILDVLNFALSLEHLESRFYQIALEKPGLIPPKDKIDVISKHEMQHVKFLSDTIKASGGTPVGEAKYDFTRKGTFPNVFSDYKQFLEVAQAFEDTGVGAYKGQAAYIDKSNEILTSALRIHSMEARHAAHIRFIRMVNGYAKIKPWIVGNDNTKGTPMAPIYKREDDHRQVLINIHNIGGYKTGVAGTASFDEPLKKAEVLEIVAPFMAD